MSESDLSEDFGPFAEALEAALDPIVADFRRQMVSQRCSKRACPAAEERWRSLVGVARSVSAFAVAAASAASASRDVLIAPTPFPSP